jgi:molecular chaperone GrpE
MSKTDLQENIADEEFDIEAVPSLDDFMRELEERESKLEISAVKNIEVDNYFNSKPDLFEKVQKTQVAVSNGELENLRSQVEKLKQERLDMSAAMNRRQSDFESFKKRTERERNETFQKVLSRVGSQMIPVVDNLNRALDSAASTAELTPEMQQFLDGIVLVNQQIQDVLTEMGIEPILSVGKMFDPHFHEAVSTEQREDIPQNTIVEELLRGYRVGETVIRAAMVKVAV